jgi:hypothetical protein
MIKFQRILIQGFGCYMNYKINAAIPGDTIFFSGITACAPQEGSGSDREIFSPVGSTVTISGTLPASHGIP